MYRKSPYPVDLSQQHIPLSPYVLSAQGLQQLTKEQGAALVERHLLASCMQAVAGGASGTAVALRGRSGQGACAGQRTGAAAGPRHRPGPPAAAVRLPGVHIPHSCLTILRNTASTLGALKYQMATVFGFALYGPGEHFPFAPCMSPVTCNRTAAGIMGGGATGQSAGCRPQVFVSQDRGRLYGFKGLAGRLGPIGVHASMLAIMAGVAWGGLSGWKGSVMAPQVIGSCRFVLASAGGLPNVFARIAAPTLARAPQHHLHNRPAFSVKAPQAATQLLEEPSA